MINDMRQLALDYLIQELGEGEIPENQENWYSKLCVDSPGKLFPYLVEDSGKVDKVYIIMQLEDGLAGVIVQDVVPGDKGGGCPAYKLPFIKPSGSQSAAVGPVIKRTYSKEKGGGPSEKILATSINYFREIAKAKKPWSPYFEQVLQVLDCPKLKLHDGRIVDWPKEGYSSLLACVVDKIGQQKNTVFLTVQDSKGLFPGEQALYIDYLLTDKLAGERYVTASSPAQDHGNCPLCGKEDVMIFPNALKGAGINILNADRAGVFPGIDSGQAWKGYALCATCADLLYVFKFHVLKKINDKVPFSAKIAGENALVIPSFSPGLSLDLRQEAFSDINTYIHNIKNDVEADEDNLLEYMKEIKGILNFTVIWSDLGQNLENVTGMITQVLPSRLKLLSAINAEVDTWQSPLFPKLYLAEGRYDMRINLALTVLNPIFWRPGGDKAKSINNSKQLFQVKRQLAEGLYHGRPILSESFWREIMVTARWYFLEGIQNKDHNWFLYENVFKKGMEISAAAWVKQVNRLVYHFKHEEVGVLTMEKGLFEPKLEILKPFFGKESGIDTKEKAYAFILGVIYGKLLQIQGAKGVNTGANALTWLKRLTLKGKDLPELYIKVRAKLLAYDSEKSEEIRDVLGELGRLGIELGDSIQLDEIKTNYYLLLGQSMTESVLPSKEQTNKK